MRNIACLLGVACFAIAVTACGKAQSTPSIAPTPTPTSSSGPAIPSGNITVSGVITEAGHPVAGANVNAWIATNGFGYSYMYAHGAVVTDANGGYRLPSLPAGATAWLQVYKDGYVQQCAEPSLLLQADATVNAQLVSKANLSGLPAPSPNGLRTITGVIVETTSDGGKRPLANVFVDFEPLEDFPAAVSFTDVNGRFSLCGLPQGSAVSLGVGLGNRVTYASVPSGQTAVEITLP
jgi:hypothetical protein